MLWKIDLLNYAPSIFIPYKSKPEKENFRWLNNIATLADILLIYSPPILLEDIYIILIKVFLKFRIYTLSYLYKKYSVIICNVCNSPCLINLLFKGESKVS